MRYCQHCGAQINEQSKFCGSCGAIIERQEPNSSANSYERTIKNKHKLIGIATCTIIGVLIVVGLILIITNLSKPKYGEYEDVLEVCFDALNTGNTRLLDDVVYEKFGSAWNYKYVYGVVEDFAEEKKTERYGKLTTSSIEDYEHITSDYELEEIKKDWRLSNLYLEDLEDIEELCGIETDYGMEIVLGKIDGRWYVLSIDV